MTTAVLRVMAAGVLGSSRRPGSMLGVTAADQLPGRPRLGRRMRGAGGHLLRLSRWRPCFLKTMDLPRLGMIEGMRGSVCSHSDETPRSLPTVVGKG